MPLFVEEAIASLVRIQLSHFSDRFRLIDLEDFIGQNATIRLDLWKHQERLVNC
jgi:hypothetical protein